MTRKLHNENFDENKYLQDEDKIDPKNHYKDMDYALDFVRVDWDEKDYNDYLYRYKKSGKSEKKLTKEEYLYLLNQYEELKNKAQKYGFTTTISEKIEKIIKLCLIL